VLLVWADDQVTLLNESWIKARWPDSQHSQRLGKNLFLVCGVEVPGAGNEPELVSAQGCPRQRAEQRLATARETGDRRRQVTALTDLGLMSVHEGNGQRALTLLHDALALVRQLGDRACEGDVLVNLALATLVAGQPREALALLDRSLVRAREDGDRFAEKAALELVGLAHAKLQQPALALNPFEQALALARAVGHRKHEADLLWNLAIQHAELGQRDQALARAHAAVKLLEDICDPHAAWFADHFRRYREGLSGSGLNRNQDLGSENGFGGWPEGSLLAGVWAGSVGPVGPQPEPPQAVDGPGFLRRAVSATQAMARYLGSGLKTTPLQALQRRLRTCAACSHHTGLRCRLCGCFTNVKARMAHEQCPLGKWSA
jgi:tetratricopeptide (TPR) repeat protein